jgi:cobalamin synthase
MVSIMSAFPYAKTSGMGLAFKQGANWKRLTVATVITLVIALIILQLWGLTLIAALWLELALIAALWLVIFGIASYFRSRLGGLTGDTYGAINELAEVAVLLLIIVIWRL